MTGFDRHNRSFYLDDMPVQAGDAVVCTSSGMTPDQSFTEGKRYEVYDGPCVYNDRGDLVRPSVRFKHYE